MQSIRTLTRPQAPGVMWMLIQLRAAGKVLGAEDSSNLNAWENSMIQTGDGWRRDVIDTICTQPCILCKEKKMEMWLVQE